MTKDIIAVRAQTRERLRRLRAQPGYSTRKNRVYQAANPEKRKAHKAVENAINRGDLVRQPCERCGSKQNVHAHHDDYSKPLDVKWLCGQHHAERHKELAAVVAA